MRTELMNAVILAETGRPQGVLAVVAQREERHLGSAGDGVQAGEHEQRDGGFLDLLLGSRWRRYSAASRGRIEYLTGLWRHTGCRPRWP